MISKPRLTELGIRTIRDSAGFLSTEKIFTSGTQARNSSHRPVAFLSNYRGCGRLSVPGLRGNGVLQGTTCVTILVYCRTTSQRSRSNHDPLSPCPESFDRETVINNWSDACTLAATQSTTTVEPTQFSESQLESQAPVNPSGNRESTARSC